MMLRRKSQVSKMQNGRSVYLIYISDFFNEYKTFFFQDICIGFLNLWKCLAEIKEWFNVSTLIYFCEEFQPKVYLVTVSLKSSIIGVR